uniref:Uncharacterized protein n=1 Tax=Physcomitrium patens TaxID=3218 RepID=A9T821_PHYPA|nr:hypothetical protein PHYPA_014042 [Physcomitrium patens]
MALHADVERLWTLKLLSLVLWALVKLSCRVVANWFEPLEEVLSRILFVLESIDALVPGLLDYLVRKLIWRKISCLDDLYLLLRPRRVSMRWYEEISSTLDWCAVDFARLDAAGSACYVRKMGYDKVLVHVRYEENVAAFKELLQEDLGPFVKNFGDDKNLDSNANEMMLDDLKQESCSEKDLP